LFQSLKRFMLSNRSRGQSFLELALVLPVLLILLLGVTEVAFYIGSYMDVVDLTREAARFASVRDPSAVNSDYDCSAGSDLNFFYDTACVISPPAGTPGCISTFCNGFNPYVTLNPATDDVVISVFTISGGAVSDSTVFSLSHIFGPTDNYKKNCQGATVRSSPYYSTTHINSLLLSDAPANKGYVAVEVYYCYDQVFGIPLITDFIPNPLQIHAYTLMPLPAAQPTPTPIP